VKQAEHSAKHISSLKQLCSNAKHICANLQGLLSHGTPLGFTSVAQLGTAKQLSLSLLRVTPEEPRC